ncbi:hypothetical protein [Roseibium aestuarii]|uniref:Uncharacterized protein n=1 Tax=Roseibium aestuarii TaxID=2600299 RepID=A0ABW4JX77_9HYPH|nr:hypothetical protein [Roseibium aestuarii]
MIPFELPRATGIRPFYFTALLGLLALAASLHLMLLAAQWSGLWKSDRPWDASPQVFSVDLEGYRLQVPSGLLGGTTHRLARLTGHLALSNLQITAVWPTMIGAGDVVDDPFTGAGRRQDRKKLLQIEVRVGAPRETMRDQLDSVFRKLARGRPDAGPGGLVRLRLSALDTAETDEIFFEPGRDNGFIARCQLRQSGGGSCLRELTWGPLTVSYRFNPSLLANWGSLERRVLTLVASLPQ